MTFSRTIFLTMAAAAMVSLAAAMPAFAQGGARDNMECLSDRQIQAAIEEGQFLSWPKIKRMAGISAYEEVSDVQVCMIGGVPYYIINVKSPEGDYTKIALNAVDGAQETL